MQKDNDFLEFINIIKNNKDFNKIIKSKNFFDIIRSNEKSYTALFAWLLDSKESHQLKNDFLNEFINQINLKIRKKINKELFQDALIISEEKIDNAIPDILIIKNQHCIVIENKLGAKEHNNQLDKYLNFKEKYKNFQFTFVYLDINFQNQQFQKKNWIYLNYEWIITFLEKKITNKDINTFPYSLLNSMLTELKEIEDYQDILDNFCLKHTELIEQHKEFILRIDEQSTISDLFNNQIDFIRLNFIYQYYTILDGIRYRFHYINRLKMIRPIITSLNKLQNTNKQLVSFFPESSKNIQLTLASIDNYSSQTNLYYWPLFIHIGLLKDNKFSIQIRYLVTTQLTEKQKKQLQKYLTSQCKYTYLRNYVLKEYSKKISYNELKEHIQNFSVHLSNLYKEFNEIINF